MFDEALPVPYQGSSMVKKTRDDAIYVTGIATDVVLDQIHETFSSVGTIKVGPFLSPPFL